MFTGMELRTAQELGLHRERTARGISVSQSPTNVQETGEGPFQAYHGKQMPMPSVLICMKNRLRLYLSDVSIAWTLIYATELARVPCIKRH